MNTFIFTDCWLLLRELVLLCFSCDRSNWNDSDNHTVPRFIVGAECLEHTLDLTILHRGHMDAESVDGSAQQQLPAVRSPLSALAEPSRPQKAPAPATKTFASLHDDGPTSCVTCVGRRESDLDGGARTHTWAMWSNWWILQYYVDLQAGGRAFGWGEEDVKQGAMWRKVKKSCILDMIIVSITIISGRPNPAARFRRCLVFRKGATTEWGGVETKPNNSHIPY